MPGQDASAPSTSPKPSPDGISEHSELPPQHAGQIKPVQSEQRSFENYEWSNGSGEEHRRHGANLHIQKTKPTVYNMPGQDASAPSTSQKPTPDGISGDSELPSEHAGQIKPNRFEQHSFTNYEWSNGSGKEHRRHGPTFHIQKTKPTLFDMPGQDASAPSTSQKLTPYEFSEHSEIPPQHAGQIKPNQFEQHSFTNYEWSNGSGKEHRRHGANLHIQKTKPTLFDMPGQDASAQSTSQKLTPYGFSGHSEIPPQHAGQIKPIQYEQHSFKNYEWSNGTGKAHRLHTNQKTAESIRSTDNISVINVHYPNTVTDLRSSSQNLAFYPPNVSRDRVHGPEKKYFPYHLQEWVPPKSRPQKNKRQSEMHTLAEMMEDDSIEILEDPVVKNAQPDLEGFKTVNLFAEYWEIPQLKTKLDESPEEKKAAQEALNSWMDEHVPAHNWKMVPKIPTVIESEDSNSFNVKIANNTEDIGASASLPPSRKRNRTKKSGTAEPKPQPQLHRGNISSISAALAPPEVIAKQEEEMDSQRRMLKVFQNLHTDMVLPQTPSAAKRPRIAKYYF